MTRSSHSVQILNTGVYSEDRLFRYSLTRCWDPALAKLLFVMHNPSKATEVLNDDTVMACQNIAWLIGHPNHPDRISTDVVDQLPCFGSIRICNLYPAFATSPDDMEIPCRLVLRENDCELESSCRWADWVVCAWGSPKCVIREDCVKRLILAEASDVLCFGKECGHPMHPGRVKRLKKCEFACDLRGGDGSISMERRLLYRLQHWDS